MIGSGQLDKGEGDSNFVTFSTRVGIILTMKIISTEL